MIWTVKQLAREFGVSKATVIRTVKQYETELEPLLKYGKRGRIELEDEGKTVLQRLLQTESESNRNDSETVQDSVDALNQQTDQEPAQNVSELIQMLKQKDATINGLLEERSKERERTDTIIMKLVRDMEDMRKEVRGLLEYTTGKVEEKTKSAMPVAEVPIPIQKKIEKKTAQAKKTFGTLYRMFLETFQPWKLRDEEEAA